MQNIICSYSSRFTRIQYRKFALLAKFVKLNPLQYEVCLYYVCKRHTNQISYRGHPQKCQSLNYLHSFAALLQKLHLEHAIEHHIKQEGLCRGVTGIFFWGGKVIFPDYFPSVKCFFPVENSHFGRPKPNIHHFQKWEKKKVLTSFYNFSFFHFQFSTFPFTIFLLFFSIFSPFPLPLFSQYVSKNFPVRSLWGHFAPPVTPLGLWSMFLLL